MAGFVCKRKVFNARTRYLRPTRTGELARLCSKFPFIQRMYFPLQLKSKINLLISRNATKRSTLFHKKQVFLQVALTTTP